MPIKNIKITDSITSFYMSLTWTLCKHRSQAIFFDLAAQLFEHSFFKLTRVFATERLILESLHINDVSLAHQRLDPGFIISNVRLILDDVCGPYGVNNSDHIQLKVHPIVPLLVDLRHLAGVLARAFATSQKHLKFQE